MTGDISDSDAPETCPACGREPVAIVEDGDPHTGSIYGDDICVVERSELPPRVHWAVRVFYIHAE